MRVYLSGPMTGIPDYNYPKFKAIAATWRRRGYEVDDPTEHFDGDQSLSKEQYLERDIASVLQSEAIILLDGWEYSDGARIEAMVAKAIGHPAWRAEAEEIEVVDLSSLHVALFTQPEERIPTWSEVRKVAEHPVEDAALTPDDIKAWVDSESPGKFSMGTTVDGTGYKASMDDPAKLPLDLIPPSMYAALGRSLGYGARKYAPNNYRAGMKWSACYGALLRHLTAWADREDVDADSGNSHLDHAAAMLAFLIEYEAHPQLYANLDDRYRRPRFA